MPSWANSLIFKSTTRSNMLKGKYEKKLKTDISVSFLRLFLKWYQERDRNITMKEFLVFRFIFGFLTCCSWLYFLQLSLTVPLKYSNLVLGPNGLRLRTVEV